MMEEAQYVELVDDFGNPSTYIIQGDTLQLPTQQHMISNNAQWVQQASGRSKLQGHDRQTGTPLMEGQALQMLAPSSNTALNLGSRFTPSTAVLHPAGGMGGPSGNIGFHRDGMMGGAGTRGRPRGRKPLRGQFPVVPIDMVRQLGIEQQVILQPHVPVAFRNKSIQTQPLTRTIKTQCTETKTKDPTINREQTATTEPEEVTPVEEKTKGERVIRKLVPVFIPIPVPIYIPVPIRSVSSPIQATAVEDAAVDIVGSEDITSDDANNKQSSDIDNHGKSSATASSLAESPVKLAEESTCVNPESKNTTIEVMNISPSKPPAESEQKLKTNYGVNAWNHWVTTRNKAASGDQRKLKTNLFELSVAELNEVLSMFVMEVRKPGNQNYSIDSVIYLCLGIQVYLSQHGYNINLFTHYDMKQFQSTVDDRCVSFQPQVDDTGLLICRIEEDHLWEAKQLGIASAGTLLFSLIYFNSKIMGFIDPENHMELMKIQFSAVMKDPTRNGKDVAYISRGSGGQILVQDDPMDISITGNQRPTYPCILDIYLRARASVDEEALYLGFTDTTDPKDATSKSADITYQLTDKALSKEDIGAILRRVAMVKEIQEMIMHKQQ